MEPITLESREGAHHLLVTHSIQHHPTSPFQHSSYSPHSTFFPISSTPSFLTFHLDPLSAKHSFFVWCHKPFLLFSCVVAVNNGKMEKWKCFCAENSPRLSFWFCYHITTARGMEALCQTRRLGSVLLPAWWLSQSILGQRGEGIWEFRKYESTARACCSDGCWAPSHAGWCVG